MPWDWQPKLKQHADSIGITLFSSPFDQTAVDFLQTLEVPAYKIASFEIVDTGLLAAVARTGKPVIVSTGMATLEEIQLAVDTLNDHGCSQICLLKCTSAYPATPDSMNLATIATLKHQFSIPIGLSDHTLCHTAAVTSVALGASVIEKHITTRRSDGGPDSSFSLEPDEFAELVRQVRTAEAAIGKVHFGPSENDANNVAFRRSLFAVSDIEAGEHFTPQNVRSIRPGNGLAPKHLPKILNSTANKPIPRGTPLSWDDIDAST
jgi:N-acetylneuraminate synthase